MRATSLRPITFLPQICTKLRKHFNAIMEVLYSFTVAIGLPGDATDYNEDKRPAVAGCSAHAKQGGWVLSEATVRAKSEILGIWAALKQLSKKMKQCALFYCDFENNKFQHGAFLLSALPPRLAELRKVCLAGCLNFAYMKASIELCISKLSYAAAISEIKANCEEFDSELGNLKRRTGLFGWLVCVKRHGVLNGHRRISKITISIHNKGDRSE